MTDNKIFYVYSEQFKNFLDNKGFVPIIDDDCINNEGECLTMGSKLFWKYENQEQQISEKLKEFQDAENMEKNKIINIHKAFLKPVHPDAFKHPSGLNGEIIGIDFVVPREDLEERLCYKIKWKYMIDYVSVDDIPCGYEIVHSESE